MDLLAVLRDPVERAYPHTDSLLKLPETSRASRRRWHLRRSQARPLREAGTHTLRSMAYYAHQLRAWFEAFSREHFLVLLTEDLAEHPAAVARQAFGFLEVDPDVELPPPSRANVRGASRHPRLAAALNRSGAIMATLKHLLPYTTRQRMRHLINRWNRQPFETAPTLDPGIARALGRRYRDEILTLEEIIGRDLGMWRSDDYIARFRRPSVPRGQRDQSGQESTGHKRNKLRNGRT